MNTTPLREGETSDKVILSRRDAIKRETNRDGIHCPVPALQAECAVMNHVFISFTVNKSDPLGQHGMIHSECIYCGAKQK